MQEIYNQLARLAGLPQQVDMLYQSMRYFWAFLLLNLFATLIVASRASKVGNEIKLLRAYLEGQRSAKAAD